MSALAPIRFFFLHAAVAIWVLWPGVGSGLHSVPGGLRTDLWNGLWSLDFQREALLSASAPWRVDVLGFPLGGNLPPVDPLGMFFFVPAGLLGTAVAYQLLIVFRLALGGWLMQSFAREFCEAHGSSSEAANRAAIFAGIATASAPVLVAGVHNGTSEAANVCGLVAAVWMGWRYGRDPNPRTGWALSIGLFWAALTSWYVAVLAFAHAGFALLFHGQGRRVVHRSLPVLAGLVLVLPWAAAVVALLQVGDGNLSAHAFSLETGGGSPDNFGAADWGAWFGLAEPRNIAILSDAERGQGFFHCTAVGWAVLVLAGIGLRGRLRSEAALVGLAGTGVIFSFGSEMAVGSVVLPMPYGVLLDLPGFSQLSLPFRYGIGVLPLLGVTAALALTRLPRSLGWAACLALLLQLRLFSSVSGGVPAVDLRAFGQSETLEELRGAPPGAVVHLPVGSHHQLLYSQRVHGQPLTIAFDRASPEVDLAFWARLREALQHDTWDTLEDDLRTLGIRYVLVNGKDSGVRGDPRYPVLQELRRRYPALGEGRDSAGFEGVVLW